MDPEFVALIEMAGSDLRQLIETYRRTDDGHVRVIDAVGAIDADELAVLLTCAVILVGESDLMRD